MQSTNLNNYNQNSQAMLQDEVAKRKPIKYLKRKLKLIILFSVNHHNMNPNLSHLQTSTSYSNEESQLTEDSEDFERFQFVNSPNDSKFVKIKIMS